MGRRYYLPSHRRRLAVSGNRKGSLHPQDRRLCLLRPDRYTTDTGGSGDGVPPPEALCGADLPQRPRRSVRSQSIPGAAGNLWHPAKYVPQGDPYDNAVAENFFSCLKCELVHLKQYPTRAAAHADVFAYLETFYNTVRPHSALGWISPNRFEALLCASYAA